jgi:hypothetical protein
LSPQGTAFEKSIAKKYSRTWQRALLWVAGKGVTQFSEPVHEEITERIFGCQGDVDVCGNPDVGYATPYVLAGVRWNDDPPFQLEQGEAKGTSCITTETIRFTTQPRCWAELFNDAKKKAEQGISLDAASRAPLLARSHFGDLQFLHAMASEDGEPAIETKNRIMMWAEFTWKVAHGDFELRTELKDVSIPAFQTFFGRNVWTVQDLFTLGNPPLRPRVKEVAFGSLLHMVQDSFAKGHVDRAEAIMGEKCVEASDYLAPGRIKEFHAYNNQDAAKHAEYDSRKALGEHLAVAKPNVIEVGQVLRGYYERGSTWEDVKPYIGCVFQIEDSETKASAGAGFRRNE